MTDSELSKQLHLVAQMAFDDSIDVTVCASLRRVAWLLETPNYSMCLSTARQRLRYLNNTIGVGFQSVDEARAHIQIATEVFESKYGSIQQDDSTGAS